MRRAGGDGTARADRVCPPSPQAIPFVLWLHLAVFVDWLHRVKHLLLVQTSELLLLHPHSGLGHSSYNRRGTTDSVCLGFRLWLLLFGDGLDLVEVALENSSVGDILSRLGQLEEDDSRTYSEEAENDGDNLLYCALEALEQNSRSDDGCAREVDVVRRCDKGSVEDIQSFL